MLIVEEMYLLLTQDNDTDDRARRYLRHGLAAAALTDLTETGHLKVEGFDADAKVTVVRAGMTGQGPLDALLPALDRLSGKTFVQLVSHSTLDPGEATVRSLVQQGVVREEPSGLFGKASFQTVNPAPEIALRSRLGQVLSGEREPSRADATELGILTALNVAYGLLGSARGSMDRHGLARRIETVAPGGPAVLSLKRIVDPVVASTMTLSTAAGSAGAA